MFFLAEFVLATAYLFFLSSYDINNAAALSLHRRMRALTYAGSMPWILLGIFSYIVSVYLLITLGPKSGSSAALIINTPFLMLSTVYGVLVFISTNKS